MYCPKCGVENQDGAQVCRNCNLVLTGAAEAVAASNRRTSGLAVTSFVLGILSPVTCFLTAPLSVIFGIISVISISRSKGRLKGMGFSIAGIVIPIAVLPFFAIMMAVTLPALAKAREAAQRVVCMNNLKQIDLAAMVYADKYGQYPPSDKWCEALKPYYKNDMTLKCPSVRGKGNCSYAINPAAKWKTRNPDRMVLFFEAKPGWDQAGGGEIMASSNHYKGGCIIAFCDGHVEFVKEEYFDKLKWTEEP